MFGLLKVFQSQDSLPGRYVWICTPEKDYRYEIFSSHVVDAAGEAYTLFSAPDQQFQQYLDNMKAQSLVDFGVDVTRRTRSLLFLPVPEMMPPVLWFRQRERENIKIPKEKRPGGEVMRKGLVDELQKIISESSNIVFWRSRSIHREWDPGFSQCGRFVPPAVGLSTGGDFKP